MSNQHNCQRGLGTFYPNNTAVTPIPQLYAFVFLSKLASVRQTDARSGSRQLLIHRNIEDGVARECLFSSAKFALITSSFSIVLADIPSRNRPRDRSFYRVDNCGFLPARRFGIVFIWIVKARGVAILSSHFETDFAAT